MVALARSFWAFVGAVLRRVYFWGFALFLDPIDLLGRFPKGSLPARAGEYLSGAMSTEMQWGIAVGLILWCAFLAYHEQRWLAQQRKPKPTVTLRQVLAYLEHFSTLSHHTQTPFKDAAGRLLRDLLSAGQLHAWGRKVGGVHQVGQIDLVVDAARTNQSSVMVPLDQAFWATHELLIQSADGKDGNRNGLVSNIHIGFGSAATDLHFDAAEVLSQHPRRSFSPIGRKRDCLTNRDEGKIWRASR